MSTTKIAGLHLTRQAGEFYACTNKTCNAGSTEELVFLMSEIIDCIIKGEIE